MQHINNFTEVGCGWSRVFDIVEKIRNWNLNPDKYWKSGIHRLTLPPAVRASEGSSITGHLYTRLGCLSTRLALP